MDIPILFEDDDLLILDKPSGIVVNRVQSAKEQTVQDSIEKKICISGAVSPESDFVKRSGIVHRIDKETSGILIAAKKEDVFFALQALFKERAVKKTYQAIVHGIVAPRDGQIHAPVGRMTWNRERFGIVPGGKDAITRYTVVGNWFLSHGEKFSFVTLFPETGRTHQIRVHVKYIGHPILGDYLYAGRKTARGDRLWAKRVMLHAKEITFPHPKTKETMHIISALPHDMMDILPTGY
jgi:23S rRNA pseudouridine1911/1915/1917 synthase